MVRRTRTELVETIERSKQLYGAIGWTFHEQEKMWRSPEGARLRFAYLERDQDAEGYQGHNYTRVYIEEAGNFPSSKPINKLKATLRSGAGVPVAMILTGNPGGPGHHWIKERFIDPAPQGMEILTDANGLQRVFIPSKVSDNKFLGDAYVQQLRSVGNENLVKAWLDGDWSVIDGAFFDCWSSQRHVIKPFSVPKDWLRFRSMDWGFAAPFSVGWWAVCADEFNGIPRGAIIRYREWYGASSPNVGLRLTAEEVADGIAAREAIDIQQGAKITYGVLDPAAFAQDGGPSIAERMSKRGVSFRRADNTRVSQRGAISGWDQMRARMKGDIDGKPMMYVFETCKDFIRTVPALQHDPDKPEDLDTDAEDHAADEARYGCNSRPWIPRKPEDQKPTEVQYEVKPDGRVMANMSVMDIVKAKERKRQQSIG